MARILTPDDYGLVGELTVFIAISYSLMDSGFTQALIRKQNRTEADNCTVFYFNLVVSIVLYAALFFCAPAISGFYNEPILTPMMRVLSLTLIINALCVVHRAVLTSNIDFKTQAKASFIGTLVGGALGLVLTYTGYGVWALVWYQILATVVNVLITWRLSPWRPKWIYSWDSFHELFGFGSKMAASGILNTLYNNIYLLVIGKVFKASDLGYYTRASQFSQLPSQNLNDVIQRVTYPVLCTITDDDDRLRDIYRRFIRMSAFIVFPLMVGMAALSQPLILAILGERWLFSATLLTIMCFSMMWYPIHSINLNLLQVKGRSDLFLKLEIIKKCVGVAVLLITLPLGLVAMCVGGIFSSLICLVINTYYTSKLIQVGFFKQMRDLLPIICYSLAMGGVVWLIALILPTPWLKLIIGTITGVLVYYGITRLVGSADLRELKSFVAARRA